MLFGCLTAYRVFGKNRLFRIFECLQVSSQRLQSEEIQKDCDSKDCLCDAGKLKMAPNFIQFFARKKRKVLLIAM